MNVYTKEAIAYLAGIINAKCADGSGFTLEALANEATELSDYSPMALADCVKNCLADTVGRRQGKNGGFYLLGVEPKKSDPTTREAGPPREFSQDEIREVKAVCEAVLTNSKGKGVPGPFVLGRLNVDPSDKSYLSDALRHPDMAEFEVAIGSGLRRRKPAAEAAPTTTEAQPAAAS